MKSFIKGLFNKTGKESKKKGYQIIGKHGNCLAHDITKYPNIVANHQC